MFQCLNFLENAYHLGVEDQREEYIQDSEKTTFSIIKVICLKWRLLSDSDDLFLPKYEHLSGAFKATLINLLIYFFVLVFSPSVFY